ncbi:MAG: DNA polymerase IV, partial [Treponema sp.]|nr:DNA polymerase IV [Treponema sp.]
LNELYDRILGLFHKKYQSSGGVRLIGAGLMNLETGNSFHPQELFEDSAARGKSRKDRRLEEAILEINRKHPDSVLRRSRSWLSPF